MASKRELWKEFWRDVLEIIREYHGNTQNTFKRIFRDRGILKRYEDLIDRESQIASEILGHCRFQGERAAYPVKQIVHGKETQVWKLASTLIGYELKQVRRAYRKGAKDQLAISNRITKRIAKQTGEQMALFDLNLLDDGPKALPGETA